MSDDRFSRALDAATFLLRLERLGRGGEGGLNPVQWEGLRFLARANRFSRTPAALADYLGSTRGTVSQTLIALEQKGLVVRQASARDGRSVELRLSKRGLSALADDPLSRLARDLAEASGQEIDKLSEMLESALRLAIARNGRRAFGVCHSCRHFRKNVSGNEAMPHRCDLLDEMLSRTDSKAICIEQEAA